MTELEKHLLKAFKHLEASYNEQQSALNQAQSDLRTMFERTSQENQALQQHVRSEEHTSELQSRFDLVCRLLLEKKKKTKIEERPNNKSAKRQKRDTTHGEKH